MIDFPTDEARLLAKAEALKASGQKPLKLTTGLDGKPVLLNPDGTKFVPPEPPAQVSGPKDKLDDELKRLDRLEREERWFLCAFASAGTLLFWLRL